jgi:hypothetical protein
MKGGGTQRLAMADVTAEALLGTIATAKDQVRRGRGRQGMDYQLHHRSEYVTGPCVSADLDDRRGPERRPNVVVIVTATPRHRDTIDDQAFVEETQHRMPDERQ